MDPILAGAIGILILLILIALRMPIGFSMGLVGFTGFIYLNSLKGGLYMLATDSFHVVSSYSFSVLPLFILMGNLAFASGISSKLFATAQKLIGHLPGGLGCATIGASAGFSAICGSSMATAATMGVVSYKEMERYKYSPALSTGCIAAGGTLGILIPPSNLFIIYGILTEESIGKLFMAGILPGILLTAMFIATISLLVLINPELCPNKLRNHSIKEKIIALGGATDMIVLFTLVMGGLYTGIFTPNESAGIGAAGALIIGLVRRKISFAAFNRALISTVTTTSMIFLILVGAIIFNRFLVVTTIPDILATSIVALNMSPIITIIIIWIMYLILGCFFDGAAITLLTIPIFFPLILALGIDPIWFGVFFCIVMEMGMITPPVGMNCYVISGTTNQPLQTVFKGILPFLVPTVITIILLIIFPQIALFLPTLMAN